MSHATNIQGNIKFISSLQSQPFMRTMTPVGFGATCALLGRVSIPGCMLFGLIYKVSFYVGYRLSKVLGVEDTKFLGTILGTKIVLASAVVSTSLAVSSIAFMVTAFVATDVVAYVFFGDLWLF